MQRVARPVAWWLRSRIRCFAENPCRRARCKRSEGNPCLRTGRVLEMGPPTISVTLRHRIVFSFLLSACFKLNCLVSELARRANVIAEQIALFVSPAEGRSDAPIRAAWGSPSARPVYVAGAGQ